MRGNLAVLIDRIQADVITPKPAQMLENLILVLLCQMDAIAHRVGQLQLPVALQIGIRDLNIRL